jgi:chromosome segregation ATPase
MDESTVKTPTPQEIEFELAFQKHLAHLDTVVAERRSLADQVRVQGDKVLRLEAELVRLRMQRTDAALAAEVDGLRTEVGKKDRELVELRRKLASLQENEAIVLHRAAVADQKVSTVQNTLAAMQRGRDAAYEEVERHDRARAEAVTAMVAAADRARRAEERLAELEKKTTVRKK